MRSASFKQVCLSSSILDIYSIIYYQCFCVLIRMIYIPQFQERIKFKTNERYHKKIQPTRIMKPVLNNIMMIFEWNQFSDSDYIIQFEPVSMSTKPPFPGCEEALKQYYNLRKRLYDYFFRAVDLKISNNQTVSAYSEVYNLLNNNATAKLTNQKNYQLYQETFFAVFKNDLVNFCRQIRQNLIAKKGISSPTDELQFYYQWIENFTWFLRWTHKILSSIQKNISLFSRTSLYYTGLTIMRDEIIEPLYPDIFRLLMANLELFKEGLLQEYTELQFMIQLLGMCGFQKYLCVKLEKNNLGFFNFVSTSRETNLKTQDLFENDYFLKRFTNEYAKHLKKKYSKLAQQMIKMSTPQYVIKANQILEKQTKAAQFFYSNESVKSIIIRSIEETLVANHCKQLISNPKSGLQVMIQADDVDSIKLLYKLSRRTSQQKIFGQFLQDCIQKYISEEILMKLSPEDERAAKREVVFSVISSLYDYYTKIQKIAKAVQDYLKDPFDLILVTCQQNGFQIACNRNSTVCIFLAFFCDAILKKQPNATQANSKQLVTRISKMLKFLYSLDQFLKIYQKMLGIRMLYDQFKNKDVEMEIINMLKNEVGIGSLAKVTTMIQDYKFSENLNAEKSTIFRNNISFNFQITLITSGAWQVQDLKNNKKLVPPELMRAVEVFETQYHQAFPGRQITWVFNYGRSIVQVKLNDQSKVLLLLNNYQLLVLLLLQRRNFQPVKILEAISEIKPEQQPGLMASIMMLVKKGVLLKSGNPTKIQSKSETITFNWELKLKVPKLGCFEVPRFAEKLPAVNNQLNAERAFIVQANIIKLMKTKRVLRYQDIVNEVIAMCKTFKAEVAVVKNQIENCIHKQYLERDAKQFNTLIYKP